jgi:hypothetical protein
VFHHRRGGLDEAAAETPFRAVKDHVLLTWAGDVAAAGRQIGARLRDGIIERIVASVPDDWLGGDGTDAPPDLQRAAYVRILERRLAASDVFVQEAERARALLV